MPPARNERCPCGSGRKYKSCCLRADEERQRREALFGRSGEPRWHQEVRAAGVWEAEVAPASISFRDDPDASPALAMVVAADFVVAGDVLASRPATAAERASVISDLVAKAGREVGVLPERLVVREAAVAAELREAMADRGVAVEAGPFTDLEEALDSALEHLCGSVFNARTVRLATWREAGAQPGDLAAFHAAAAAFSSAAPWEEFDDDEPIVVRLEDGSEWTAVVMGGAGIAYGLALYTDPADVVRLLENDGPPEVLLESMEGACLAVHFDPRTQLPRAMQREVAANGWEVAAPSAYPWLMGMRLAERRITAEHVRHASAVLLSLARLTRGEDPAGAGVVELFPLFDPDDGPALWPLPEAALPIAPAGPAADPALALRAWDDGEEFAELEQARLDRLSAWIAARDGSKAAREAALRNARIWTGYLQSRGLSAAAVTEYDLRVFLYDFYLVAGQAPRTAYRALPASMRTIFTFLGEEGIRYPFAERVLPELDAFHATWKAMGADPRAEMERMRGAVWDDLEARGLAHEDSVPGALGGWPGGMDAESAPLRYELERRWLLWHDEAVLKGITDPDALRAVLLGRQREWENTPHPRLEGRTPAGLLRASAPSAFR